MLRRPVLVDTLLFLLGLALLTVGGELLVRGASALATSLGVSKLVVGLTVVAFGTSAPELAVNISAALQGKGAIGFGNIVGSSIANIGLIVGLAALVRPLEVHKTVILREIPMMMLAAAATLALCLDQALEGRPDAFTRIDGCVLLLFFAVFLYYTINDALMQRGALRGIEVDKPAPARQVLLISIGLAGLIGGGKLTVDAAVGLARGFGVSDVVIGLTIVAVGTSLPELVTSVIASARGHADLAIGNVTGSNIFNTLFILGITAAIAPVEIPAGGHVDVVIMAALTLTVLPLSINPEHCMGKKAGIVLLGAYAAYIAWRTLG
jgi:cation:H+ antiporter